MTVRSRSSGGYMENGGRAPQTVRNELGDSTVRGPVLQTGVVHGDIHVHDGPAPPPPPRQLPPLRSPLTDRSAELASLERHRLDASDGDAGVLGVLTGLGGVGKSALALSWLHSLRSDYPDGQLFADLAGGSGPASRSPDEVVGHFLRALGVGHSAIPTTFSERVAMYRSVTTHRRLLVLLDDAATAAQVRPLIPAGPSVTVVTSRTRLLGLALDGGHAVPLEPLDGESALALLVSALGPGRAEAQQAEARALAELCGGLPLALRVVGSRLAARPGRPLAAALRELTGHRPRLPRLAADRDQGVQAALDFAYAGLPEQAARLHRLLSLHPAPEFGPSAADALLGSDAAEAVEALHTAHLLSEATAAGTERFRVHDLVREHAASVAADTDAEQERAAAFRRLADHYLATATLAETRLDPAHRDLARTYGPDLPVTDLLGDSDREALDWLERELPTLMALVRGASEAGVPTLSWQLADAMWPLFVRRKFTSEWQEAYEHGLAAATSLGDVPAQCRMLTSQGLGLLSRDPESALTLFEAAATRFAASGDRLGQARALSYQGLAHQRRGRDREAATLFTSAAERLRAVGDTRAAALATLNLAEINLRGAAPRAAAEQARQAGLALDAAGDPYNTARAAVTSSRAALALEDREGAERHARAALDVLRPLAADYETARALTALALAHEARGEEEAAGERGTEAFTLFEAAGRTASEDAQVVRACLARVTADGDG
ncbi:ATP-binding protein [Streptomyces albidoflavus]